MGWSKAARAAAAASRKRKGGAKGGRPRTKVTGKFAESISPHDITSYGLDAAKKHAAIIAAKNRPSHEALSTGSKRTLSLMEKILHFDATGKGDIEKLQRRTFALQKITPEDIVAAAKHVRPKDPAAVLDEWSGHMDSRNTRMGKFMSLWAQQLRDEPARKKRDRETKKWLRDTSRLPYVHMD